MGVSVEEAIRLGVLPWPTVDSMKALRSKHGENYFPSANRREDSAEVVDPVEFGWNLSGNIISISQSRYLLLLVCQRYPRLVCVCVCVCVCCAVLCCAVRCCAVLCCAVLCCAVLCCMCACVSCFSSALFGLLLLTPERTNLREKRVYFEVIY